MATRVKVMKCELVKEKSPKKFSTKAPVTKLMKVMKLSWVDVQELAEHCVNILEQEGDTVASIVRGVFVMIKAVSERDLTAIMLQLNASAISVKKLVAAIKMEFGIE